VNRASVFTVLLLAVTVAFASVDSDSSLKIEPQMEHRYASNIATRFLTNYHYKRTRLDDELSSEIFDSYLELLDPAKIYFLAEDIETFERYRTSLDDALRHSDLMPAYDIFNVYTDRVQQRVDYARARVQKPFDFTINEQYQYDREDEP
jgi:carboxyl-terminal processing protease